MTIPHRVKTLWNNVTIFMKSEFNHEERVDKVVSAVLDEMGYLWDEAIEKLRDDNVCFSCKNELDTIEKDGVVEPQLNIYKASKTEKGCVAFVTLCEKCRDKLKKSIEKEENEK